MAAEGRGAGPELSLIMPCYNEEEVIPHTIPDLLDAFEEAGRRLELVAVDNGSTDRTGAILRGFADAGRPVVPVRVEVNEGYGKGVLAAIPHCSAPWIGIIPADGQVDAEDVVRLFTSIRGASGWVIGKVRRRFRLDGLRRKLVSILYNGLVLLLWPRMGSIDVNGSPKILPADLLRRLDLQDRRWFLDPELMIKAHHLGVRVVEMNVFARMRSHGLSHVRMVTCWHFFRKLLAYRFGSEMKRWREQAGGAVEERAARAER